jgi:GTP cyclohydrolase I
MDEAHIEQAMASIIRSGLGLDLSDPNLRNTPRRVAKMFCRELFKNVGVEFTKVTCFPAPAVGRDIIMFDNIDFVSCCSHHFLPFVGRAWLLYIPNKKIVGASKPARIVEHYSKRPQLQETLCRDVLTCFQNNVSPDGAMVFMRAIHQCMTCRGVRQNQKAGMTTSSVCGSFLSDPSLEIKGLEMVKLSTTMILS